MVNKENEGKVMTVLGPINPIEVGNTTTHDHVLINFQAILTDPLNPLDKKYMEEKISLENIGWVRFNWSSSRDNLVYEDEEIAYEELGHYKNSGGQTIVDVTNIGLGRNPNKLRNISKKTGVNIWEQITNFSDECRADSSSSAPTPYVFTQDTNNNN